MRKLYAALAVGLAFTAGVALSAPVHDWHDLDEVHKHVVESIHEMEHARAANHYDMDGHGARAEQLLRDAEHELGQAVESAKRSQ